MPEISRATAANVFTDETEERFISQRQLQVAKV